MKKIIERNLPLNTTYILFSKTYVPLENSAGTCCDNCGRPISYIAAVADASGKSYYIGFDCLETILLNNSILLDYTKDQHDKVKKDIAKIIRFSKTIKEFLEANSHLRGIDFESEVKYDWITFYYTFGVPRRYNSNVKIKDLDVKFLVEVLRNIFPNLTITIE